MKKNIFYISMMSCICCLTLSTVASATSFTDTLINYCVPKANNNCDPKTDKATYTSAGCSCSVGREYNEGDRNCVECLLKGGGYNGYYKTNEGVGKCAQIVCSGGSYLTHYTTYTNAPVLCGGGYYRVTLQQD